MFVKPMTPPTRGELGDAAVLAATAGLACVGVWAELHFSTTPTPSPAGAFALTLGAASALLVRRRWPVTSAAVCIALCYLYRALDYPGFSIGVLIFVACYTLAVQRGLVYGLAAAVCGWIIPALPPHPLALFNSAVIFPPVGMSAIALIGEANRRRSLETEARVRESAAAAEARLGRRMVEERLRIARELHDVVAHTISVVTVQSGVALDALAAGSEAEARVALRSVRAAAKQAMPELRAALDLLRGEEQSARPAPQPGFEQLPELVRLAAESGVDVELSMPEGFAETSPVIELTVYRIVQESLTNVLKHAPEAHAEVRIDRFGSELMVRVTDDGRGSAPGAPGAPGSPGAPADSGFGLLGMRERAESLGGSVLAGPVRDGGFQVTARLPWISRAVLDAAADPHQGPSPEAGKE